MALLQLSLLIHVCIDSTEVCSCFVCASASQAALCYLERHNPNNLRGRGVNWMAGLEGVERRYLPYNGALG